MASFGINISQINKTLILHAHFDHIGIIPYFKRKNPQLEVYASVQGWEILKKEKAIATINEFSSLTTKRMGLEEGLKRSTYIVALRSPNPDWGKLNMKICGIIRQYLFFRIVLPPFKIQEKNPTLYIYLKKLCN